MALLLLELSSSKLSVRGISPPVIVVSDIRPDIRLRAEAEGDGCGDSLVRRELDKSPPFVLVDSSFDVKAVAFRGTEAPRPVGVLEREVLGDPPGAPVILFVFDSSMMFNNALGLNANPGERREPSGAGGGGGCATSVILQLVRAMPAAKLQSLWIHLNTTNDAPNILVLKF